MYFPLSVFPLFLNLSGSCTWQIGGRHEINWTVRSSPALVSVCLVFTVHVGQDRATHYHNNFSIQPLLILLLQPQWILQVVQITGFSSKGLPFTVSCQVLTRRWHTRSRHHALSSDEVSELFSQTKNSSILSVSIKMIQHDPHYVIIHDPG